MSTDTKDASTTDENPGPVCDCPTCRANNEDKRPVADSGVIRDHLQKALAELYKSHQVSRTTMLGTLRVMQLFIETEMAEQLRGRLQQERLQEALSSMQVFGIGAPADDEPPSGAVH